MKEKYVNAKELVETLMEKWSPDMSFNDLLLLIEGLKKEKEDLNWISCQDRLPIERENPITMDWYVYPVKARFEDVEDIRYYCFGNGHWYYGPQTMDEHVVSWLDVHGFVEENISEPVNVDDDTHCMDCQCANCAKNTDKEMCGNCKDCNAENNHQIWDFSCQEYKNE